jgi:hypothetical protein
LPEDLGERQQFQRQVAQYGGPLRAIAGGLGIMSKAVPQGGSFAKILAIYSNEVAKAADAAGEPPLA